MILSDENTDHDQFTHLPYLPVCMDRRLYYLHDATRDTTAVLDGTPTIGGAVVERYAYQNDGDPLAFDARWQRIVRRSAAAPTPELAAEFLFGQSAWLTMGSPTITRLDARFPALYESSATPGQWSNARDGRLLTPDPLAAAAGRNQYLPERSTGDDLPGGWQSWVPGWGFVRQAWWGYQRGEYLVAVGSLIGAAGDALSLGGAGLLAKASARAALGQALRTSGRALSVATAVVATSTWGVARPLLGRGLAVGGPALALGYGAGLFGSTEEAEGSTPAVASRFLARALRAIRLGEGLEWLARSEQAAMSVRTFATQVQRGAAMTSFDHGLIWTLPRGVVRLGVAEVKDVTGEVAARSLTTLGLGPSGITTFNRSLRDLTKTIGRLRVDGGIKGQLLEQLDSRRFHLILVGNTSKGTVFTNDVVRLVRSTTGIQSVHRVYWPYP